MSAEAIAKMVRPTGSRFVGGAGATLIARLLFSRLLFSRLAIGFIYLYQWTLGQLIGGRCRFYPSCSNYGIEAISSYGAIRGIVLTARRLLRCHPFNPGGYDPPCNHESSPINPPNDSPSSLGDARTQSRNKT